jgi:hypothetical protein
MAGGAALPLSCWHAAWVGFHHASHACMVAVALVKQLEGGPHGLQGGKQKATECLLLLQKCVALAGGVLAITTVWFALESIYVCCVGVGWLVDGACRAVSNFHPDNWQSVNTPGCVLLSRVMGCLSIQYCKPCMYRAHD